jgi:hypothetical protein
MPNPFSAKALKLDYFKIYDVANQLLSDTVMLQGQFDADPETAKVVGIDFFANVASKNGEAMFDRRAHLTWYRVFDPSPEPMRRVVVENQFGEQTLVIGPAKDMLVPARTYTDPKVGLSPLLDHFKVYRVRDGAPINRVVALKDEFRIEKGMVTVPIAFAVPAVKTHAGTSAPIKNKEAHLVIYRFTPREIKKIFRTRDQFSGHWLTATRTVMLAAPSIKKSWK